MAFRIEISASISPLSAAPYQLSGSLLHPVIERLYIEAAEAVFSVRSPPFCAVSLAHVYTHLYEAVYAQKIAFAIAFEHPFLALSSA